MTKLDGLGTVLDFIKGLQPKISNQIAKKILSLGVEPFPQDSEALSGYADLRRVTSGEYRIIYRYKAKEDLVEIILIAKRNDDEVYKKLKRQ